jgi:hypothetical protein
MPAPLSTFPARSVSDLALFAYGNIASGLGGDVLLVCLPVLRRLNGRAYIGVS